MACSDRRQTHLFELIGGFCQLSNDLCKVQHSHTTSVGAFFRGRAFCTLLTFAHPQRFSRNKVSLGKTVCRHKAHWRCLPTTTRARVFSGALLCPSPDAWGWRLEGPFCVVFIFLDGLLLLLLLPSFRGEGVECRLFHGGQLVVVVVGGGV